MNEEMCGFTLINGETGKEVRLAMEGLWLTGRVLPVGARLLVAHTFQSDEKKPLEVVYAFGLPRDAALRRFKVAGEGFQVRSELRPVQEAQEAYEKGISEGHLSSLARAYRDGRVNLFVGNLRPGEMVKIFLELVAGVDLRDDGLRFRFPFTLAPCYHRHACAAEVGPGVGVLELPEEEFGDILLPRYMTDSASLHRVGFDLAINMGSEIAAVTSPSHVLRLTDLGTRNVRATLNQEHDVPDRDLVLDVQTSEVAPRCYGGLCRNGKVRFTAVAPAKLFGKRADAPKSVVFILDRSGSMQGRPLEQAKKAVEACVGALGERDRFGFVAFDDRVELFGSGLAEGTIANRDELRLFLAGIDARGGTEICEGIQAAVTLASGTPAELMVITDGQVSATEDIMRRVRTAGARLHCLGIGAASQDRFLTLLARETGGVSRFLAPRERVDMAALELFAALGGPVATNVQILFRTLANGRAVSTPPTVVYEDHPLVVMGEADRTSNGVLPLTWGAGGAGGRLQLELNLEAGREAETVRLLQGARLITDLDSQMPGELQSGTLLKRSDRESRRLVKKLEQLSREYGLTSRAMALVAVMERKGDDSSEVPITRVVPVGMPEDTTFASYFSPSVAGVPRAGAGVMCRALMVGYAAPALAQPAVGYCDSAIVKADYAPETSQKSHQTPEDELVALASCLMPDGGMPGKTDEDRVMRSLVLLVAFLAFGHTTKAGAFRLHVRKLVTFINQALPRTMSEEHRLLIERVVAKVEAGQSLPIRDREQTLRLLASSDVAGGKPWEAFEHELAGLV